MDIKIGDKVKATRGLVGETGTVTAIEPPQTPIPKHLGGGHDWIHVTWDNGTVGCMPANHFKVISNGKG